MKELNAIYYGSRKLKDHKRNYAIHNLELAAIVHALKVWTHYVMGKKFELRTDHISLKYLFEQSNLNSRKARWLEFIYEFEFEIKHVRGKENKVVDALKKNFHVVAINIFQTDLRVRVLEVASNDEFYLQEKKKFHKTPVFPKFEEYYLEESNLSMYKDWLYILIALNKGML